MTKAEIIYNFILALNKSPYAEETGWGIVRKAVDEYDDLVDRGIIEEKDTAAKPNKSAAQIKEVWDPVTRKFTMTSEPIDCGMYDYETTPAWVTPGPDNSYDDFMK